MTNVFESSIEETAPVVVKGRLFHRPLLALGIACIALCALYITSVRMVQAGEYALRDALNSRDTIVKQYDDLGRQLDLLRSLSTISQAQALAGFQEVQKPSYLNMDSPQSVAVANK